MKTNTKEVLTSSFPKHRKEATGIQSISNIPTEVKPVLLQIFKLQQFILDDRELLE
jgi:hypothetical protein